MNSTFTNQLIDQSSPVTAKDVRALFSRRNFVRLVMVRIFGQTGDGIVQAALTSFVLFSPEQQPTAAKIAIAFSLLLLPYSIFGPFVGTLIDRWPRQRILVSASLLRAFTVALVWLVVTQGFGDGPLAVVVLFSLAIGRFLLATLSASLPHVARDRELTTANAFAPTAGTLSSALGGILGVAIQQIGGENGVTFALTAAIIFQVTAGLVATTMPRNLLGPDAVVSGIGSQVRMVVNEIWAGWKHLKAERAASSALLVVVWHRHIFGLATVWVLVLLRNALNTTVAADTALVEFAVTVGAAALGALIGASLAPVMVGRMGTRSWSTTVLLSGAPFAAVGFWWTLLNPTSTTALIGLLVSGAALGWIGQSVKVCGDTVIQAAIDDNHRGRVFAIYDMAVNAGLVSGIALGAYLLAADGLTLWPVPYIFTMFLIAPLLLRIPPR